MTDQMNDYLAWPYATPADERLYLLRGVHASVRRLLDATEDEFAAAVKCRCSIGTLRRLAHELGCIAQMETALDQMVTEADQEARA